MSIAAVYPLLRSVSPSFFHSPCLLKSTSPLTFSLQLVVGLSHPERLGGDAVATASAAAAAAAASSAATKVEKAASSSAVFGGGSPTFSFCSLQETIRTVGRNGGSGVYRQNRTPRNTKIQVFRPESGTEQYRVQ